MALIHHKYCSIRSIVNVLPNHEVANASFMSEDAFIDFKSKTGISTRRIVNSKSNPILDYVKIGIEKSMQNLNWKGDEIDVIICITQTSDQLFPPLSLRLHGDLGMSENAICFDVNLGCSAYPYGLQLVYSLLESLGKTSAKAILCVGDISSTVIASDDAALKPLFSDAISVTAIEKDTHKPNASYFHLQSFGSGQNAIYSDMNEAKPMMRMNGLDVFNYSYQFVPKNIAELVRFAKLEEKEIEFFVFHQANRMINEAIRKRLQLEIEKVLYSIDKYANTAAASIPVTIAANANKFLDPRKIVLGGFGVGFSIASSLLNWQSDTHLELIEYAES